MACLVATGCQAAPATRADSAEPHLGEVFTLGAGQDATIDGEGLRVKFGQVLADSRCPRQVNCFWTGEARISVLVQQRDAEPAAVQFNTNPAPNQNKQIEKIAPHTIELRSLDPYPETPAKIPFAEYRATFLVNKE